MALDGAQGSQSEGLAIDGRTAYLSYAASGSVVSVDLDTAAVTPYSQLPQPASGMGFTSGLARWNGKLYGGLVSFAPSVQPGIYRVDAPGQPATLFAHADNLIFPNGLWFDDGGQLYVTDSAAGAIFRISTTGAVTEWLSDPLLAGDKDACGVGMGVGLPFDIGANGLAFKDGAFWVTNTDRGTLVRVPLAADGSAGQPTLVAGPDCANLSGADGLVAAPNGDFIIAVNHQNKLVRVDGKGAVSVVLASDALDFPTSLTFVGDSLYLDNFAFFDAKKPGVLQIR